MISRAYPAINLGPTGNMQGTHTFLSLVTGKKIKRRSFTPMPMPASVIKKVERYADAAVRAGKFAFANRKGLLFKWNDVVDENAEHIIEDGSDPYPALVLELPGISLQRDHTQIKAIEEEDDVPQGTAEEAAMNNADIEPTVIVGVARPREATIKADNVNEDNNKDNDDSSIMEINLPPKPKREPIDVDEHTDGDKSGDEDDFFGAEDDFFGAVDDDSDVAMDKTGNQGVGNQGVQKSERSGRGTTSRYKDYELLTNMQRKSTCRATIRDGIMCFLAQDVKDAEPAVDEDHKEFALGVALSTYGLRAGIKKFGEKGLTSVKKELKQMHDLTVFVPVEADSLTAKQKSKAIRSLINLKEKRTKEIKTRLLADGRCQRGQFTKQETTSPTVARESVIISAVIDAHERRHVNTYDIPDAFLNADCNEDNGEVIMILKGRLAEMMAQVSPVLYRKYITLDGKGTPVL